MKFLKKALPIALTAAIISGNILIPTNATVKAAGDTEMDLLSNMTLSTALRANRLNTTFDYDAAEGGYKIVTSATNSKHFMYMTDTYLTADNGYIISVDYKLATTDINEGVGFIIGAKDKPVIVSGDSTVCEGLKGADVVKTYLTPYSVSGENAVPRFRMSNNDKTNAYDYGNINITTAVDSSLFREGWNTVSMYVGKNWVKNYVNGTMVWSTDEIKDISGYVGLFSFAPNAVFKNFTVREADLIEKSELITGLRCNDKNTTFDYNAEIGGSQMLCKDTTAKYFMYMTDVYATAENAYYISAEYKVASENVNESVGFIIGAPDTTPQALYGGNVYKTAFTPYALSSGSVRPRLRMSSNDHSDGTPYNNGASYNVAIWADAATLNDGWNTISMYVSKNEIRHYVNGTLVWEITDVKDVSGYIGLFSGLNGASYRNFTVTDVSLLDQSDFALGLRANASNTTFAFDEQIGGYTAVSTAGTPKYFMYVTDKNASVSNTGVYEISVDVKAASSDKNEGMGFIIGAADDSADGLYGSNVYKAMFLPNEQYTEEGSITSVVRPRFRISSNDKAGAPAYDNGTYNEAEWADAAQVNDGWNNISLTVSEKEIKVYVNGTLIWNNTKLGGINGFIGLYSALNGASFKNFRYSEKNYGTADLSEFTLSNSLRGTQENSALVYNKANDAYIWQTSAANPKHNYFMSDKYKFTAGEEYTVSVEFKGTSTDVVPQTGIVIGASYVEGKTEIINDVVSTSCEGLKTAFRSWGYFDASENYNRDVLRIVRCDGTKKDGENDVWDITANNSVGTGRIAYYGYRPNDWNKMTVRVTDKGAYYYINDRFVVCVLEAADIGGYVGIYALQKNAMYRNFTVTAGAEIDDADRTVIACVGDSITYGTKATALHYSYPSRLQEQLGEDYEVLNFGMPGHTAIDGVELSYMQTKAYKDSLEANPDIVVLMLGTNDVSGSWWEKLASVVYEEDLTKMINSYKQLPSNPKIYLCTTPYVDEVARPNAEGVNEKITQKLIPIQQRVAVKTGCEIISMYAFMYRKDFLLSDGCHPTDNGYHVMADKVYNALTDSVYGDINGDKVIDIRDLIRMKKVTAQMEVEYIRANSDIDFDGTVAATDAVVLRRYLVGDEDAIGGNETEKTPVSLEEEMASIS